MNKLFPGNKFKLAYTFLILAFLVAACNYPVTQEESAGDILKWTVSKNNTEAISKIENLEWLKTGEYNINEDGNFVSYSLIVPKENHANVSAYNKQLESITGIDQINIIPLNETVKRPVYSVLLNGLFKIDINATNMSDAELSNEISSQLKNAGLEAAQIDFEKDEKGHRRIKVIIPDHQLNKDGGFDMTIKDGNNVTKLKEVRKTGGKDDEDRFAGKTDEEIRSMVREDLSMPELKDDEIDVIKEDGKVMVKVNRKVNKEKIKIETEDEIK